MSMKAVAVVSIAVRRVVRILSASRRPMRDGDLTAGPGKASSDPGGLWAELSLAESREA